MNKLSQVALDVGSDQAATGSVLTAISDLACSVGAQDRCYFDFRILFQHSLTTASMKLDLGFPSSPTSIVYNISIPAASGVADTMTTSSNRACNGTTLIASANDYLAQISGVLINGANAGVLQPQFASTGLGTVTVRAGSCGLMTNL